MKKILSIIFLTVMMLIVSVPLPQNVMATENVDAASTVKWNFNKKNIELSGGYYSTRFQAAKGKYCASTPQITSFWDSQQRYNVVCASLNDEIYIQRYDEELNYEDTITISKELPLFGNAICDGEYYYIVWGQNDTENTNCTVICLAKYSMSGEKISCCDINGYDNIYNDGSNGAEFGTKYPFYAGTVRMSIQSGVISCIYARKMYNDIQSNYCFYVDCDNMTRLSSDAVTYCSNSFDQAVLATSDGGYLYANHGNSEDRAFKIDYVDTTRNTDVSRDIFHFREGSNTSNGDIETYAQLGNIAEGDNGYFFCGSSEKTLSRDNAPTTEYLGHNEARNLFVQVLKKDFYNFENADMFYVSGEERQLTGTKPDSSYANLYLPDDVTDYGIRWLTDYDNSYYVNNPQIVVTDDKKVIVLWEKLSYATHEGCTCIEILDENMNVIQSETELNNVYLPGNTDLSYHDGKVVWTTSDNYGWNINVVNLKYDDSVLTGATAKLENYSVALPGNIALNCYFDISDAILNDSAAYVSFIQNSKETKVPLSSLENLQGFYKATYNVAAAQMDDDITVQVVCRNHKYDQSVISVTRYADYVLQNQNENDQYKKAVPLIKAMLNYGGYAQQYFSYKKLIVLLMMVFILMIQIQF